MEIVPQIAHFCATTLFLAALIHGGLSDLFTYEIPNWNSVAIALAFLTASAASGWSVGAIAINAGIGALVLAAGVLLYAKGLAGGGDVKLLAASMLWIGWPVLVEFLVLVALAGGVLALALLAIRRFRLPARLSRTKWVARLHAADAGVPYGVAIAAAAVYLYPLLPLARY